MKLKSKALEIYRKEVLQRKDGLLSGERREWQGCRRGVGRLVTWLLAGFGVGVAVAVTFLRVGSAVACRVLVAVVVGFSDFLVAVAIAIAVAVGVVIVVVGAGSVVVGVFPSLVVAGLVASETRRVLIRSGVASVG